MTVVGAVSNTSTDNWSRSTGVSDMAFSMGIPFLLNDRNDEPALVDFIEYTKVLLSAPERTCGRAGRALNLHLAAVVRA